MWEPRTVHLLAQCDADVAAFQCARPLAPVHPAACRPAAHGDHAEVEICNCGSTRRTNRNQRYVEVGPWVAAEPAYATWGSVRGNCGHRHATLAAAVDCLRADQRGCRSQGGYSDREVVRSGDDYDVTAGPPLLSDAEQEELEAILFGD